MGVKTRVLPFLLAGAVLVIVALIRMPPTKIRSQSVAFSINPTKWMSSANQQSTFSVLKNKDEHSQSSSFNFAMIENSLKKRGYTVDNLPPRSALWTDKIHLCVMFNLNRLKPEKEVTDVLASYYYPFFRDITFIFDGANWTKPDFSPKFVDFIGCDSHVGWYQQKCIRLCMQQGTEETEGYLYIADDMFINLTKMADLPTTKVWSTTMERLNYAWILNPGPKGWGWPWWGQPYNNARKLQQIINILPSEWLKQMKETAGFPDHFSIVATSDIIYIPRTVISNLTTVIDFIVNSVELFSEVATCLAVNIAAPNNIIFFEAGYLWYKERTPAKIEEKARTAHFVHPIKLATNESRKLWIKYMENQLYNIVQI